MRQPLKVLVFAPEPSLGGGVVEFSAVLRRRLGADVRADWFLTGRRPGALGKALRAVMPFVDALRLAALLGRERHDVYHLNPSLVPRAVFRDALFLLVLRLFRRGPVLVFFRGWDTRFFSRIAASGALLGLFRWVYGYADRLVVLGSSFAESLAEAGFAPETIHTLTTMFDGELFDHAPRVRDPEDGEVRILFMARFVAAKGLFELLEAFRRLAREDQRLTLCLAGDGEERARAEAWCRQHGLEDRVKFPGYVGGTDKALALVNADIFALPSRHGEGCPNALLEAMAAGLPVVVTPVGGIPDIVRDGVHGLVVPPDSTEALETALRLLIRDRRLRAKMGHRNREEAWKLYEANAVTARLESHYLSLALGTGQHDVLSS
jgi:glycosyltransferase involved in cell wall biosynthesis